MQVSSPPRVGPARGNRPPASLAVIRHAHAFDKVFCPCGVQSARITLFRAVVYSFCLKIPSCSYRETSIKQGIQDLSLGQ